MKLFRSWIQWNLLPFQIFKIIWRDTKSRWPFPAVFKSYKHVTKHPQGANKCFIKLMSLIIIILALMFRKRKKKQKKTQENLKGREKSECAKLQVCVERFSNRFSRTEKVKVSFESNYHSSRRLSICCFTAPSERKSIKTHLISINSPIQFRFQQLHNSHNNFSFSFFKHRKIPIKNIKENNFKGKHAARAAFFAICALAFYQLICNCFIVLSLPMFLTANNCFASVQFLSSRKYIKGDFSRCFDLQPTRFTLYSTMSLNLSILIGTQFAATDCQQQNLFCSPRSFVYETIFCLCAWISKESFQLFSRWELSTLRQPDDVID